MSTNAQDKAEARARSAALLADARLARKPFGGFPADLEPRDEREGYAIQDALNQKLSASLGPVVGYKIGCTTRALQEFMKIDNPCAGAIFASTVFEPGVRLDRTRFVRPGIECEIGVRLRSALDPRDGPIDRKRAAAAVEAVFTSIEIVDERYVDYRALATPVLVADNFMNAGCIKGAERNDVDPLALDRARGSTVVNGETVGAGVGSDILGHPLEALMWLAAELGSRGRPLAAGTFVSLGSMVKPYFPQPGDRVTIVNDMLGEVALIVA